MVFLRTESRLAESFDSEPRNFGGIASALPDLDDFSSIYLGDRTITVDDVKAKQRVFVGTAYSSRHCNAVKNFPTHAEIARSTQTVAPMKKAARSVSGGRRARCSPFNGNSPVVCR